MHDNNDMLKRKLSSDWLNTHVTERVIFVLGMCEQIIDLI